MAVTYDENVIVTFAARLYRRAAMMVALYAVCGTLAGALAALVLVVAGRIHLGRAAPPY
jgi:hypothetical protein